MRQSISQSFCQSRNNTVSSLVYEPLCELTKLVCKSELSQNLSEIKGSLVLRSRREAFPVRVRYGTSVNK